MNKYDNYYTFRIADLNDVDSIMRFIRDEWSETHILGHNRDFLCWMYGNKEYGDEEKINFVLMLDNQQQIVGLNGFVVYSDDLDRRYVSSAITKVKSDLCIPMCGVELIKRFHQLVPAKAYYSAGTNPSTILPIGKKIFHYDTGLMCQYYILNERLKEYKVAVINQKRDATLVLSNYQLKEIKSIDELADKYNFEENHLYQAYKSKKYINKRFFEHPIYKYRVLGIVNPKYTDTYSGVLFCREIEVNDSKICRVVDYLGEIDNLAKIGGALRTEMYEKQYEYVDFVVSELPEDIAKMAGFCLRTKTDENVIPMYFEPFVQKNIDIYYQRSDKNIMIFKADGDQDRPNKF